MVILYFCFRNEQLSDVYNLIIEQMFKEFGFKDIHRLNITASTRNICTQYLAISPSGNLLASINQQCQISLYNTSTQEPLKHTISNPLKSVVFTADDRFVLYATPFAIIEYDIHLQKENIIVGAQKQLQTDIGLSSLTFSNDYRTLFYVNRSAVYSISRIKQSAQPQRLLQATQNCTIANYKIYSKTSFITSSKKCFLCRWDKLNGIFTPSKELDLNQLYNKNSNDGCTLNQLAFDGAHLYISREINVNNKVDILIVNPEDLALQKNVSKRVTFPQATSLVFYQNYIITCLFNLRNIWINHDALDTSTSQHSSTDFTVFKAAAYNPHKNQLYQYWYSWLRLTDTRIAISQLTFDCTKVNGTTSNSSVLQADCPCQSGHVFNKQSLVCQPSPCLLTTDPESCPCPAGFRRNRFNWNCILDCSAVEFALPTMPFGNPYQCHCAYPYIWQGSQCIFDCSLVPNAMSIGMKNSCSCKEGFKWDSIRQLCLDQSTPTPPKTPNTQISKPLQVQQIAAVIIATLSLVLVIVYIIFYYKYRRRVQSRQEKKDGEGLKTDRPLSDRPLGIQLHAMASDQKLAERLQKNDEYHNKQQKKQIDLHNIDNFSITDEDDEDKRDQLLDEEPNNQEMLSGIESKVQQPLKQ